jgi:lysine biosynthesis protein LysW
MTRGFCPECDAEVNVGKGAKIGQKITCHSCGAFLEVIETSPIELDWAFDNEEEMDDDDYFDDDDDDW